VTQGHRYQAVALSWLAMFLSGFVTIATGAVLWVLLGAGVFVLVFVVCAVTGHLDQERAAMEQRVRDNWSHEERLAEARRVQVEASPEQATRWFNQLAENVIHRRTR
jgi:hypothetical protein